MSLSSGFLSLFCVCRLLSFVSVAHHDVRSLLFHTTVSPVHIDINRLNLLLPICIGLIFICICYSVLVCSCLHTIAYFPLHFGTEICFVGLCVVRH
jgi:hypothetical protein